MVRRRSQALRRMTAGGRRPVPPTRSVLGWAVAGVALIGLAVIVGRPSGEQQTFGGASSAAPIASHDIVFGTGLDSGTNEPRGITRRFGADDTFAYAVTLPDPPGVAEVLVEVVRVEGGEETVVQEASVLEVQPHQLTIGFQLPADRLLAAWGPGDYEMRIYLAADEPATARGRFALVETPESDGTE